MNRYEQNHFRGVNVRIDGEAWLGNLIEGCQVEIDHPPAVFDGNVLRGNGIRFVGEMERAMCLLAKLAAADPQLRVAFQLALGLDSDAGTANSETAH
jgi:hypothetical protein